MLEEFKNKLYSLINSALPLICHELEVMKKSYFSETGKPEWEPLKEKTVKRKSKNKPINKQGWVIPAENANKFNIEFGFLRNSIHVDYELHENELVIIVEANHKNGDAAINRLIGEYGRDFFHFDAEEINFIVKRLREIIAESFK